MNTTENKGFTLIELMVTTTVVALLAAIAYPNYLSYVQKTRRSDAKIGLMQTAQKLERCYTEFNKYNDASNCTPLVKTGGTALQDNLKSPDAHYGITAVLATDGLSFTLTATPVTGDPQASDLTCGNFILDSLGNKSNSTGATSGCW
jgi:type IV pilus assembly protein PilE